MLLKDDINNPFYQQKATLLASNVTGLHQGLAVY